MRKLEDFVGIGAREISADEPAGVNYRYGDEYETVLEQIAKLDSVSGGEIDWDVVAENCWLILTEKSKDIKIAAVLCRALFHGYSYAGLQLGLTELVTLCNHWWLEAMPTVKKNRARVGAIGWLDAKLPGMLAKPAASETDAWQMCIQLTQDFDQYLSKQLDTKVLDNLLEKLSMADQDNLSVSISKPVLPEADSASTSAHSNNYIENSARGHTDSPLPVQPALLTEPPPEIDNSSDTALRKSLTDLGGYLVNYCPDVILGYQIHRHLAWHTITTVPESDENNKTLLNPPPADRLRIYQEALAQPGSKTSLVCKVELSIVRAPFWLGGHHLVWQALQADEHYIAANAVLEMAQQFVARLPRLLELRFSDGSEFVDETAANWLQTKPMFNQYGVSGNALTQGHASATSDLFEQAQAAEEFANSGDIANAFAIFATGLAHAHSPRQRYLWELEHAVFCLKHGYAALAVAITDRLYQQALQTKLADWEPELENKVAACLVESLQKLAIDFDDIPLCWKQSIEDLRKKREDLFA